jgi:hypothetical protein
MSTVKVKSAEERRRDILEELRGRAPGAASTEARREQEAAALNLLSRKSLEQEKEQLRTSAYPGPECLRPYEIEQYLEKELPEDRAGHLRECDSCRSLIAALEPTAVGAQAAWRAVQKELHAPAAEQVNAGEPDEELWLEIAGDPYRRALRRLKVFVPSLISALPLTLVAAVLAILAFRARIAPDFQITGIANQELALCSVALVGMFLTWLVAARGEQLNSARAAGVFAVLLISGWSWYETGQQSKAITAVREQESKTVAAARELAAPEVARAIAAAALNVRGSNVSGGQTVQTAGPVQVTSLENGNAREYLATLKGIPGPYVGTLSDKGDGTLSWQRGNKSKVMGYLTLGKVTKGQSGAWTFTNGKDTFAIDITGSAKEYPKDIQCLGYIDAYTKKTTALIPWNGKE